ncbi:hypothetical protein UVI_02024900 [Ustilaginoidea virens]|uniref:Uncharacterized protein n=1 Tax=Ustilaginoidea virens TaxID=1159556 RepID=A0A1B5KR04_USTVR|nr:hypothetical protein UVI_02024900 [Ustilaginoidea virens]
MSRLRGESRTSERTSTQPAGGKHGFAWFAWFACGLQQGSRRVWQAETSGWRETEAEAEAEAEAENGVLAGDGRVSATS